MTNTRRAKGTGSITALGNNVWRLRVGVGKDARGHARYVKETFHGTQGEAEIRIRLIRERETGRETVDPGMSLDAYFRLRFLPAKRHTSKANVNTYIYMWRHIPQGWKGAPVSEVPTYDQVQEWLMTLTAGTARSALRTLRAVLRHAYANGYIEREPLNHTYYYPRRRASADAEIWTVEEIAECLYRLQGDPLEAYVIVAAMTGARREEVLAITWSDLEFSEVEGETRVWVRIEKARTADDGLHGVKTDQSTRRVPIVGFYADRLYQLSQGHTPDETIVTNGRGGPLSIGGLRRRWTNLLSPSRAIYKTKKKPEGSRTRPAGKLHGLPPIKPNSLRHSNTTLMRDLGLDASILQAFHGHAAHTIEQKHYIKRTDRSLLNAAYSIADAIEACSEDDYR